MLTNCSVSMWLLGAGELSDMALRCLTSARMNMSATLLHQNSPQGSYEFRNLDNYGDWVSNQDPLTGEIVRVWQEHARYSGPDNLYHTDDDIVVSRNVPCLARGVVDGGVRSGGNTEMFGAAYESIEYVRMWVPASVRISKRDRVTNIKDPQGRIIWNDEEFTDPFDPNDIPKATVFNVNGVTPLLDAFNNVKEQFIVLQRAQVAGDG